MNNYIIRIPIQNIINTKETKTIFKEAVLEIEVEEVTTLYFTNRKAYNDVFYVTIKKICRDINHEYQKMKGVILTSIFE